LEAHAPRPALKIGAAKREAASGHPSKEKAPRERAGHEIVIEYVRPRERPQGSRQKEAVAALFEYASRRKFDCVLFWALDRSSREGMAPSGAVRVKTRGDSNKRAT
jgi:hypothetical protein